MKEESGDFAAEERRTTTFKRTPSDGITDANESFAEKSKVIVDEKKTIKAGDTATKSLIFHDLVTAIEEVVGRSAFLPRVTTRRNETNKEHS